MVMIKLKYIEKAINLAKSQKGLANSPAEIDSSGNIQLCAAACLAYVGIESVDGKKHADEFLKKLANNSKSDVIKVFEKFGWGKQFCETIMIQNDETPRNLRIQAFIEIVG